MKDIKILYIGLGQRGSALLKDCVLPQGENVVDVCDVYFDRAEEGAKMVEEAGLARPGIYTDYIEALDKTEANTVIITTSWESHIEIAVAAMKRGKATAFEVGGAYSVDDCFRLVDAYEENKTPFMLLENCCFGRRELMVLNMVEKGLFGEIVHCSGGYHHDLREEVAFGRENRHYRLRNYLSRNCENYPTHELGPIARVLKINHGNRMLTLTSTASKAVGMHDYIMKKKSDDEILKNAKFAQGDIVTTVIKCANGETITLTLDTTLPRFYSRGFTVRGTNGLYEEATDSVFIDDDANSKLHFSWRQEKNGNAKDYEKDYEHPLWKQYLEEGVQGGHDGMDWLEFKNFFKALREDKPMPVDVYDAAAWMSITALSEESIAMGSAPVAVPDFTRGKWHMNKLENLGY